MYDEFIVLQCIIASYDAQAGRVAYLYLHKIHFEVFEKQTLKKYAILLGWWFNQNHFLDFHGGSCNISFLITYQNCGGIF
jgi:hypothetical protein